MHTCTHACTWVYAHTYIHTPHLPCVHHKYIHTCTNTLPVGYVHSTHTHTLSLCSLALHSPFCPGHSAEPYKSPSSMSSVSPAPARQVISLNLHFHASSWDAALGCFQVCWLLVWYSLRRGLASLLRFCADPYSLAIDRS